MKKSKPRVSIAIPTYNGEEWIGQTLKSILHQSFRDFEIVVSDDGSQDNTLDVIKKFKDKRIRIVQNPKNLGYGKNLQALSKLVKGEILFLMGQDDILAKDALLKIHQCFAASKTIGAVARPYFWFDRDINKPIRAKNQLNPRKDELVRINHPFWKVIEVLKTIDQLSGLAFRRKFLDEPFHQDIFVSHVYPFLSIFKKHPVVFLKDYTVGVRIRSSQTRHLSSVYQKSPVKSWIEMFNHVLYEKKFEKLKKACIKNFAAKNYIGLVQIKNYAKYTCLLREIFFLLYYRWENIFSLSFWFFSLGCLIIPARLLIPLVDWYKNEINSRRLKNIKLNR